MRLGIGEGVRAIARVLRVSPSLVSQVRRGQHSRARTLTREELETARATLWNLAYRLATQALHAMTPHKLARASLEDYAFAFGLLVDAGCLLSDESPDNAATQIFAHAPWDKIGRQALPTYLPHRLHQAGVKDLAIANALFTVKARLLSGESTENLAINLFLGLTRLPSRALKRA